MRCQTLVALFASLLLAGVLNAKSPSWKKHTVMEQGHCNTAVAIDANGDKLMDVVASVSGKVSLFIAPDFTKEVVLHRFTAGGNCIHSTTIDVDGDGDLDWAGTIASDHPFWLETPALKTPLKVLGRQDRSIQS